MLFKKTFRKLFTLFLSLIMILGSLPLSVFALSISGKYSFLVAVDKVNNVPSGYTAIYSATDFHNIRNNPSGKYILMQNIDLSVYTDWTSIVTFSGILEGNGYIIFNTTQNISGGTATTRTGVFGTNTGTIRNLGIESSTLTADTTSGVLFGGGLAAVNEGIIENCYINGTLDMKVQTPTITAVGAICAYNTGTLNYCHSLCAMSVLSENQSATQLEAGGVIGENSSIVFFGVFSGT